MYLLKIFIIRDVFFFLTKYSYNFTLVNLHAPSFLIYIIVLKKAIEQYVHDLN